MTSPAFSPVHEFRALHTVGSQKRGVRVGPLRASTRGRSRGLRLFLLTVCLVFFQSSNPTRLVQQSGSGLVVKAAMNSPSCFVQAFVGFRPLGEFLLRWSLYAYARKWSLTALLVAAYLTWRWFYDSRSRFSERGSTFTGTQTMPVCLHCYPDLGQICTITAGQTKYKKFHVPFACARCSAVPHLYGSKPVVVGLTPHEYQCVTTYGQLNAAKTRDIHSSFTNILDSSSSYTIREAFLNTHLQELHDMESAPNRYFFIKWYDRWTRSYRQATPWLDLPTGSAGSVATTPPEPYRFQMIHRLRSIWTWTSDHAGLVPQMAIINGPVTRVQELVRPPAAYVRAWFNRTPHFVAAETGAQPMEPAVVETPLHGPEDHTTWFTSNFKAFRLGPIFSFFSIWDTKLTANMLSILQGRSSPKEEYKKESECARRIGACYSAFRSSVLKPHRVLKAYNEVMIEYDNDLVKMLRGKFSEKQIEEAIAQMEVSDAKHIPKRKLNGKLEVIAKEKKFERGVVDNQLFLLSVNVLSGKVLEHMVFHKPGDRKRMEETSTRDEEIERPSQGSKADTKIGGKEGGVFSRMCIKEEDRSKILDKIIAECSNEIPGEDIMLGEVDQTGMELHERCSKEGDGVMGHFLSLLQHINTIIAPKLQAKLVGLHGAKLEADVKSGMILKLTLEGVKLTARFPDLYLDSGWLLTSLMNFMNECFVTYSAHVSNPEHLFTENRRTKRFRIEEGTHDWFFDSVPLDQLNADGSQTMITTLRDGVDVEVPAPRKKHRVYFRGWFEGDDGIFRLSRVFIDSRGTRSDGSLTNPTVEEHYKDAGYSTKLKYVVDGRAEFVGAHVLAKNGLTDRSLPWVPAIGRYLLKIGLNTSVRPSAADNAARAASLAIMFGGRVQIFACMFQTLMRSIMKDVAGKPEAIVIDVKPYSIESRVMSEGEHTLSSIVTNTDLAVNRPYKDAKVQIQMIENSFELPSGTITTHDLNKMLQLAEIIHCDMDDEAAFGYLPAALRR